MKLKLTSLVLPALLAFAAGAFAADAPKPAPTLDSIVPQLAAPLTKESLQPELDLARLAHQAGRPGAEAERAAFATALCAKASDPALPVTVRYLLLRQVAWIGGAESVEPLTKLLADPDIQIREYARMALAKNASPKAGAVLMAALKKADDGRTQIGFISALGERREPAAVDLLAAKLQKPETAPAAISALGKIGSSEAVAALKTALPAPAPAAVDALLVAARRMHPDSGSSICLAIYNSDAAPAQRAAALNLLTSTDAAQAKKLFPAALASAEVHLQSAAISSALQVYSPKEATAFLAPALSKLSPVGKGMVLRALDVSGEKEAISLMQDPDADVQAAAVETLGRIGTAAGATVLLELAGDKPLRETLPLALALTTINGPGAEDAIRSAAAKGEPKRRAVAITVLGWRNSSTAAPALAAYAAEADPIISRAACGALKIAGTDAEIMPMVQLVQSGKVPNAASAVRSMAARSKQRHAFATQLLARTKGATGPEIARVCELLSLLGGSEAMEAVIGYTRANDPEITEGALRALCGWPEFEAVKPLLAIAADTALPEPRRLSALRAVEPIVLASIDTLPAERVQAALAMLKIAWRAEEKGLAISVLGSIPNRAASDAMLPLIANPELKDLACQAGVNLAEALIGKRDKGTAQKLLVAVQKAQPSSEVMQKAERILGTLVKRK